MKQIELTQNKVTLVDDSDYDILNQWSWNLQKSTENKLYAARYPGILMHRVILCAQKGDIVIHKDGNGLNNQRSNLEFYLNSESGYIKSQYRGVGYDKSRRKWRAYYSLNGKTLKLGSFETEIEAALAYNKAVKLYKRGISNVIF